MEDAVVGKESPASHGSFEVIVADDAASPGVLEAILADAGSARVMRVGNRLRSPLTLNRVLAQIGYQAPAEVDEPAQDRAEAVLLSALYEPEDQESRVILSVEQAQSLTAEACRFLWQLSRVTAPGRLPLRVIVTGTAALRQALEEALGPDIVRALGEIESRPGRGAQAAIPAGNSATTLLKPPTARRAKRSARIGALLMSGVTVGGIWLMGSRLTSREPAKTVAAAASEAAAALAPLASGSNETRPPGQQRSAQPPENAEAPTGATDQALSAETQASAIQFGPVEPPGMAIARLHREFDSFLSDAGDIPVPLTPAQRDRLFRDYLLSRSRH